MRVVGKYTAADVKLPDGSLDEATANQIQSFCDCPAFVDTNITIMPDCPQERALLSASQCLCLMWSFQTSSVWTSVVVWLRFVCLGRSQIFRSWML